MKHKISILLCLLVAGVLPAAAAEEAKPIELAIGQKLDYSTTAMLVFPADDSILTVERKNDTQVTLVGLKAGTTQVIFSDEGQLSHINVVVSTTVSASTLLLTPEFNTRYPFLLFEFNNNSSFTQDQFYQSPNYSYNGTLESPFIAHTHLRAISTYTQQSTGGDILNNGTLSIVGSKVDFLFGSLDAAIGRQTNAIISSVPGYGPRLRFLNPFVRKFGITENLNIFGGIQPQANLLDPQDGQRKAGFNYTISTNPKNTVFQDFFNIGFVAYQPPNVTAYHYNGVAEATWHLSRKIQLGGGAYLSNSSYGLLVTPIYQTDSNLTQVNLRFVRHGLEQAGGSIALNDQHNYTINTRKIFKDKITTLSGSASHQIIVASPDGTTPGNNATNVQVGLFRQYTISRRYGANYGFSRSSTPSSDIYSNVVTGYYAHPFTRQSYFQHTLSGNQSNPTGSSATRQIQLNDMLQYETLNMRHQLGLTSTYTEAPQKTFGVALNGIANFFSRYATIQLNGTFTKTDVVNDVYQFQLTPTVLVQPTTTQLVSLSSGMNYLMQPSNNTFTGSMNIVYRRYMGPGVVKDSLVKHVFKIGAKLRISGRVFQDVNYNNRFEQGDLGLENVALSIDGKTKTITGPGGIFSIANISPGQHTIIVETSPIQNINEPVQLPIYITSDSSKREIPVPVQEPKAVVTVRTILDSNDNKTMDETDSLTGIRRIELTQGDHVRIGNGSEGGTIFNGVDIGKATVAINPADIEDSVELASPVSQTIQIDSYKEYIVNFLFKAIRSLRGQVIVEGNEKHHPRVTLKLGDKSATPDKEGYYWIKDLKEGVFNLTISGIPSGLCVKGGNAIPVEITSPFSGLKNIILSTHCE